jgi:hypothetical protein
MEREYELFEKTADGDPLWRGHASGLQEVRLKLQEISRSTTNECFAMYLPTKEIVARLNVGGRKGSKPMVFQIAYANKLAIARTEVLRLHGYEVVSVIGNESAKTVLTLPQAYDLFIVGHAAPTETRREIVAWLKSRFPGVPVLALNPSAAEELVDADYNVKLNGPEAWLPVISSALSGRSEGPSSSRS